MNGPYRITERDGGGAKRRGIKRRRRRRPGGDDNGGPSYLIRLVSGKKKRDVALIRHRKRSQLQQSTQSSRLVKDRRIAVVPTSSAPRPACLSIVDATETPSSAENRRSWILSIQLEAANDLIVFSIFSFWRLHSAVTLFFSIRHVYSTVDTERTKVNRVDYWIFFLLFLATNKRLLTLVSQKEKERKKGEKDRLGGSCRAMF